MKKILINIIALSLSISSFASEIPKFIDLKDGERINIKKKSQGCFHSDELDIAISSEKILFYRDFKCTDEILNKIGHKLIQKDKVELDKLFTFYSSEHKGGCTTVETLTVEYFKNGICVSQKTYIDDSGDLDRTDKIKSLEQLSVLISNRNKKEKSTQPEP